MNIRANAPNTVYEPERPHSIRTNAHTSTVPSTHDTHRHTRHTQTHTNPYNKYTQSLMCMQDAKHKCRDEAPSSMLRSHSSPSIQCDAMVSRAIVGANTRNVYGQHLRRKEMLNLDPLRRKSINKRETLVSATLM